MTAAPSTFGSRYVRFIVVGLMTSALAAALGYYPTLRLAGRDAIPAMVAGCVIAMLAGGIGVIPACVGTGRGPQAINRVLGSTALRMGVVVVLTLSVVFSGWFATKPLLLWVAIAYLFTLVGETVCLLRMLKSNRELG